MPNLLRLDFSDTLVANFNAEFTPKLKVLRGSNSLLSSLCTAKLPNLTELKLDHTGIVVLDLSASRALVTLTARCSRLQKLIIPRNLQ